MAVDTRNKRFSMLGLNQPGLSPLPNPDGAFSDADRAMFLYLYHGIALDELIVVDPLESITAPSYITLGVTVPSTVAMALTAPSTVTTGITGPSTVD